METANFTQPKITGYRQLNPTEAALMNEGKALAEQVGAWIEKLRKHPDVTRFVDTGKDTPTPSDRWCHTPTTWRDSRGTVHLGRGMRCGLTQK